MVEKRNIPDANVILTIHLGKAAIDVLIYLLQEKEVASNALMDFYRLSAKTKKNKNNPSLDGDTFLKTYVTALCRLQTQQVRESLTMQY